MYRIKWNEGEKWLKWIPELPGWGYVKDVNEAKTFSEVQFPRAVVLAQALEGTVVVVKDPDFIPKRIYRVEISATIYRDYEAKNKHEAENMAYGDPEVPALLAECTKAENYYPRAIAIADVPEDGFDPDFSDLL